jgi:hypothetical protein
MNLSVQSNLVLPDKPLVINENNIKLLNYALNINESFAKKIIYQYMHYDNSRYPDPHELKQRFIEIDTKHSRQIARHIGISYYIIRELNKKKGYGKIISGPEKAYEEVFSFKFKHLSNQAGLIWPKGLTPEIMNFLLSSQYTGKPSRIIIHLVDSHGNTIVTENIAKIDPVKKWIVQLATIKNVILR